MDQKQMRMVQISVRIALSPFAPNSVKEKVADFAQDFVRHSGRHWRLDFFDAQTGFLKAQCAIPELVYDSPRARTKALGQPLLEAARFLQTNGAPSLTDEPGGNVPGLLRTLPISDPPPITLLVASPWHQPKKADAGFSMLPGQLLPTDYHLQNHRMAWAGTPID